MLRNFFFPLGLAIIVLFCIADFAIGTDTSTSTALAQLESRFFEHQYDTDTDEDRISRIEQFVFGCTQTGLVNTRLQHIVSTIPDDMTKRVINSDNQTEDNTGASETSNNTSTSNSDNDQSANQTDDDQSSYSSYPRVTSLEQEILGHSYQTDNISNRLARLETKAFGRASSSNDLGDRVDALDDYAQRHDLYGDRKIANNTNSSLAFVQPKSIKQPSQSVYPNDNALSSDSDKDAQPVYTSKTGSFVGSIEERVSMMEAQEFDHTYPEKPLDKRLKKLEKKILPAQDNSQLGIFQRTSKLWIALHPSDKNTMDNLIADNDTGNSGSFQSTDDAASNTTNSASAKHGSWLHKLANQIESSASAPYSGSSNFSGAAGTPGYPYPGSFYVPPTAASSNSRFIGGSFGPGVGPGGLPVGFW